MDVTDLKGMRLVAIGNSYRGGSQKLTLTFAADSGDQFTLTLEPERGADLWETVQKVKPKKGTR